MDTSLENSVVENLERRAERRADRRKAIMMGGAALAGLMLTTKMAKAQSGVSDADVLNFALNLEYLEAQFYTLATAGVLINDSSIGLSIDSGDGSVKGGTVTTKNGVNAGITPVPFVTSVLQDYANETAMEERNHVSFLQAGLKSAGAVSVAMPNIDLYNSFNTLSTAAGIGPAFDPFASETNFLLGAFIFEDVGVSAYNGGATLLTTPSLLQAAAGILAVEAYHAGSIRTRIFAAGTQVQAISQQIATARAALSAAATNPAPSTPDDIGVGTASNGNATIVDADTNGITFVRTPTQVLNIVYAGSAGGGGFFPNGLNGNVK
jgi:Tfp pilus assembly protein FimT